MVEKILNNTTPYGKIRASREGLLHSSTLSKITIVLMIRYTAICHHSSIYTRHTIKLNSQNSNKYKY